MTLCANFPADWPRRFIIWDCLFNFHLLVQVGYQITIVIHNLTEKVEDLNIMIRNTLHRLCV